jgi:hypothetical protein
MLLSGGSYDPTTAWGLDDDLVEDVCVVFRLASRANNYPDTLGYGAAVRGRGASVAP